MSALEEKWEVVEGRPEVQGTRQECIALKKEEAAAAEQVRLAAINLATYE